MLRYHASLILFLSIGAASLCSVSYSSSACRACCVTRRSSFRSRPLKRTKVRCLAQAGFFLAASCVLQSLAGVAGVGGVGCSPSCFVVFRAPWCSSCSRFSVLGGRCSVPCGRCSVLCGCGRGCGVCGRGCGGVCGSGCGL